MQHCYGIEALDQTLQDILEQDIPFGGLIVLFGENIHQIPPVIQKGSYKDVINALL